MQWIQGPRQSNVDILNNVRREVSRHFRNKKKAYLRAKIEELETNSKIQDIRDLYRGINDYYVAYAAHLANYTLYNRFLHNMICCHNTLFTKTN